MWAATLLTMSAAAFGRLLVVNLMPSAILVLAGWITVHGVAVDKGDEVTLRRAVTLGAKVDTLSLLLAILLIAIFAAMTQSFQFGFIRFFEGYWGASRLGIALSALGIRRRLVHQKLLEDRHREGTRAVPKLEAQLSKPAQHSAHMQRKLQREMRTAVARRDSARARLDTHFPPKGVDLLPTRLGNAMRSFERRAGERYGYETIPTWPRLFHHLSDRLMESYGSSVDALHAAVNFTLAFGLSAAVLTTGFWDDPQVLWLPGTCAVAAVLAYRGALSAAQMIGVMQFVAYDLHRFDMLTGLRQQLPLDGEDEIADAQFISALLSEVDPEAAKDYVRQLKYEHKKPEEKTPDAFGS